MDKKKKGQVAIIAIVVIAVILIVIGKQLEKSATSSTTNELPKADSKTESKGTENSTQEAQKLPVLLEMGAGKCQSCKAMKPVLEELEKEFQDKLNVKSIDVWQNEELAKAYKVNIIPTQIFIDPDGNEKFRHEGFFAKEDIIKKWQELGYLK